MKIKVALQFGLLCFAVVCSAKPADEFDNENAAVPALPPKQLARTNLLNKRNPIRGGSVKTSTTTTTTTTLPPDTELEEEPIDDGPPEEQIPVETTSTTEEPRKLRGGVRPFRSNQDLLDILKKKREQAIINKAKSKATHHEAQESAPATPEPEKPQKRPSSSSRGRFTKKEAPAPVESEEPLPAPASPRTNGVRRFRN